jgi:hypothetical protein
VVRALIKRLSLLAVVKSSEPDLLVHFYAHAFPPSSRGVDTVASWRSASVHEDAMRRTKARLSLPSLSFVRDV